MLQQKKVEEGTQEEGTQVRMQEGAWEGTPACMGESNTGRNAGSDTGTDAWAWAWTFALAKTASGLAHFPDRLPPI